MATAMRTALVDRIGGWALSRPIAGRLTGDDLFRFKQQPPEAQA